MMKFNSSDEIELWARGLRREWWRSAIESLALRVGAFADIPARGSAPTVSAPPQIAPQLGTKLLS